MVMVMVVMMTVSVLDTHDELGIQGKSPFTKAVHAEHTVKSTAACLVYP